MSDNSPERPVQGRARSSNLKSLEAALLLKGRFKKRFHKLPLAVQRLARPAFSVGENGPLLWDRYSPASRLAEARRWDFEHDQANDSSQDKMWELQPAITREITQTENDAIPRQLAKPASELRDSELRDLWRRLATLKADEQELLTAGLDDLHAIVDRLWKAYGHLVTPPGPASRSKGRSPAPVGTDAQPAGMSETAIDQNNACREAERQSTPSDFRSGAPGRPTSMFLINDDLRRRVDAGVALPNYAEEAAQLHQWLIDTHRGAPRPTEKTIKNNQYNRRTHREYRETRKAERAETKGPI